MIQQNIIRDKSNMGRKISNRHFVTVDIEDVIVAIGCLNKDAWTTRDVADALRVNERAIRATIRWLKRRRLIREVGRVRRLTGDSKKEYFSKKYEIVVTTGAADFATLNRVFCGS